jgi:multiple sugar transport system substrate-binding protein
MKRREFITLLGGQGRRRCAAPAQPARKNRAALEASMTYLSRRRLIARSIVSTAALAGITSSRSLTAFAQQREISMLGWQHFVTGSDIKLKELLGTFQKDSGLSVRSDHVPIPQLASKQEEERRAGAGHDIIMFVGGQAWRNREYLIDLDDVVSDLTKQYGSDIYPFAKDGFAIDGHWKVLPFIWTGYLGNYLQSKFNQVEERPPDTWSDLLRVGRKLKEIGHPVGIPISHCEDAHATFWSICWSFGANVLEADGKTITLKSPKMVEAIEYYRELYATAMEPEVLSWDDLANNRCINAGHCAWIHNPVSSYLVAVTNRLPIAADLNHHSTPAGPGGRFFAPVTFSYGIWKFSKNIQAAKDLLRFLFRKDSLRDWIQAGAGFNIPIWRYWENHPVWTTDPKLKLLPAGGLHARMRWWPARPSDALGLIDNAHILPEMVAKAIGGASVTEAISWATDQIAPIVRG